MPSTNEQLIVLIHGLGGHRWLMKPLQIGLEQHGFAVHKWGYRSFRQDIEFHGNRFRDFLQLTLVDPKWASVHIVAHSMGAIVTRYAFEADNRTNRSLTGIGKIVLLCPPNQGSAMARRLGPWCRWIVKTPGQLADGQSGIANNLSNDLASRFDVGVLAAKYDTVVERKSTQLPGISDYKVVPSWHTGVLFRQETALDVSHFIRHCRFR